MSQNYALIVAGGQGSRMNREVPKQFLELEGLPVLMHTVNIYYDYDPSLNLVVVLPQDEISSWKDLCDQHRFKVPHEVHAGGKNRTESVQNGLNAIKGTGLVAIHDGVRPFVSKKTIHDSFFYAEKYGNAVAAVKLKDSLRIKEPPGSKAVDRDQYYSVQTPQTFNIPLVKKAYEVLSPKDVSDDATVLENYGEKIFLIEGTYENIKITTPEDLEFARLILERAKKK